MEEKEVLGKLDKNASTTSHASTNSNLSNSPVLLEGWLDKQSLGFRRRWQKRYFVVNYSYFIISQRKVREHKLFYYKSKEDLKPSASIDLFKCSNVIPISASSNSNVPRFGFQLNTPERFVNYLFSQ